MQYRILLSLAICLIATNNLEPHCFVEVECFCVLLVHIHLADAL